MPLTNFQIIDRLIHELQKMHNENLIHIQLWNHRDENGVRSFLYGCAQEIEIDGEVRRRLGRIHIEGNIDNLTVIHYFRINGHDFTLAFPNRDPFVLEHLEETFREWVLGALIMPIHERGDKFNAYLEQRKLFYANARVLARHLPGIPDDVGTIISRHIN